MIHQTEIIAAGLNIASLRQGSENHPHAKMTLHSNIEVDQHEYSRFDHNELMAAYASRQKYVPSILRVLMEMSEEQRRLSLVALQAVMGGSFGLRAE